jgi:hypothetical protein
VSTASASGIAGNLTFLSAEIAAQLWISDD